MNHIQNQMLFSYVLVSVWRQEKPNNASKGRDLNKKLQVVHGSEEEWLVHLKDLLQYYVETSGFQRCYTWARQT